MIRLRRSLKASGFPPSVWKQPVDHYEELELDKIYSGSTSRVEMDFKANSQFLEYIARLLNNYRAEKDKSLPQAAADTPGCGAGEEPVKITTEPKAKRIQYINEIYYKLCETRGANPNSDHDCKYYNDYSLDWLQDVR